MKRRIIRASLKALRQRESPASCANNQQDLFNHSVIAHVAADECSLCQNHAESARCTMETAQRKPTYSQEWAAYNQAQVNEKAKFMELLYGLCQRIEEPPQVMGRPRALYADLVFAICLKVYTGLSGRRNQSDLREALQRGYLSKPLHYNTLSKYFERDDVTPLLRELIIECSLPLKYIESNFAVDSSGFSTGIYQRWMDAKWGKVRAAYGTQGIDRRDWVKVHVMCGCKTNIITSVEVTHAHGGDSPQFEPLVEQTSQNFTMDTVCADKAYSSNKNLKLVLVKGAQPYIPFRSTARDGIQQSDMWRRLYRFYMYKQEQFAMHYHKRSNVETVFSMIKRKFGERLRCKTATAQTNEVLCKVLAHNICVIIQSMYELDVDPTFAQE